MTDPFDGQWRDLADVLTAPDQPAEPVADKQIQRLQAKAAEKRADRRDAIQTWSNKRGALREERRAGRAERREFRAEKRADRQETAARAKDFVTTAAQRLLVTGPILAPMAVAWTGQSEFAIVVLGWAFVASLLYAAAYELTTVYWAWLYHQARSDGDSGWEYRLATWLFAAGAAVQQWWHYSNHWHATPRSVTYSVMSAVGVLLWEGRARLIHRRKLRGEGKLPPARPRIGPTRWMRYPVRSWTAWSLITLEAHRTLDEAWTAANDHLRTAKANRENRSAAKKSARANRSRLVNRAKLNRLDESEPEPPVYLNQDELANPNRPELEPVREPDAEPEPVNQQPSEPVSRWDICAGSLNLQPPEPRTEPEPEPPNQGGEPRTPRTVNQVGDRAEKRTEQVEQVLNLISELGYAAVKLPVVQKRTGMSKTTAHYRLKEARAKWNQKQAA